MQCIHTPVWICSSDLDDLLDSIKLVQADFNATVHTPTGYTPDQVTVRHIHSDHEGSLESHAFKAFGVKHKIHHTMSPPHDHDLNPIAERVIAVIETLTIALSGEVVKRRTCRVLAVPGTQRSQLA